jgi:hypothetical protein
MNTLTENPPTNGIANTDATSARARVLFRQMQDAVIRHTDTIFARLMICGGWRQRFCELPDIECRKRGMGSRPML